MKSKECECPICFRMLESPCVYQPCGHTFCRHCVERCLRYDIRCPICRRNVQVICPSLTVPQSRNTKTLAIKMNDTRKFGFTLIATTAGVAIKSFAKHSVALKHGMKLRDVLISVNSIPCYTLVTTLKLLESVAATNVVDVQISRAPATVCGFDWLRPCV